MLTNHYLFVFTNINFIKEIKNQKYISSEFENIKSYFLPICFNLIKELWSIFEYRNNITNDIILKKFNTFLSNLLFCVTSELIYQINVSKNKFNHPPIPLIFIMINYIKRIFGSI